MNITYCERHNWTKIGEEGFINHGEHLYHADYYRCDNCPKDLINEREFTEAEYDVVRHAMKIAMSNKECLFK
jgi:transposase-like protein